MGLSIRKSSGYDTTGLFPGQADQQASTRQPSIGAAASQSAADTFTARTFIAGTIIAGTIIAGALLLLQLPV